MKIKGMKTMNIQIESGGKTIVDQEVPRNQVTSIKFESEKDARDYIKRKYGKTV